MEKMDLKPALYGMDLKDAARAVSEAGEAAFRGRQLIEWLYRRRAGEWNEIRNLPKSLLEKLSHSYSLKSLTLVEALPSSNGQSTKFLFKTPDGHLLESVLISQQDRQTVCVSTQLGCKMKCAFCASGQSFDRNLTAGEIVEQISGIEKKLGKKISNVVYMGMGEPLDNFQAVLKSLEILQAEWGFAMGARRITVSTVGISPKIEEFVEKMGGRVRLSISLHTTNEKTRNELVPVNRRYNLRELSKTLRGVRERLKREITFEYTLLEGVNDTPEEARGVLKMAQPLSAKVNLIPYNPIREADFKRPSPERIEAFRKVLEQGGLRVMVRQTAGRDIDAACGQLRLDRAR